MGELWIKVASLFL